MGRAPSSAAFEPEPLGPRRRRIDPVLIGVVVVVIALAVAVIKPWAGPDANVASASASARPSAPAGVASPPASTTGIGSTGTSGAPIAWSIASAASRPHGTWGVRAIVPAGKMEDPGFSERWAEATRVPSGPYGPGDPDVGNATRWAAVPPTTGVGVLALGLTFPPDELPLDVRVLGATKAGWVWLDTNPLDPSPAVGAELFAPPRIDGATLATWPLGAYRFQILLADSIRQMDVDLADRSGVVPDPGDTDPVVPDLPNPFVADLGPMGMGGPFTVEHGLAIPWPASIGPASDAAAAWRSAYGIDDAGLDRLPAIYAPTANGLGYVFPTGATAAEADLVRILPAGPLAGARRAVGARTDEGNNAPYAIFRAPDGRPWPAGIYRMSLRWTDEAGSHQAAVHLDLHPGALTAPPTILGSLPGLAWAAGRDVALGARAAGAQPLELACPGADEAAIVIDPPVAIGVGHGPGAVPTTVKADLLVDDLPPVEQPLLVAREPVPGLTVLAPATGVAFASGRYRLTFEEGTSTTTMDICPGMIAAP